MKKYSTELYSMSNQIKFAGWWSNVKNILGDILEGGVALVSAPLKLFSQLGEGFESVLKFIGDVTDDDPSTFQWYEMLGLLSKGLAKAVNIAEEIPEWAARTLDKMAGRIDSVRDNWKRRIDQALSEGKHELARQRQEEARKEIQEMIKDEREELEKIKAEVS